MKREDYVFCIGYQGGTAVVDRQARSRFGRLSTAELVEKGLYRPAFCSALYSGSSEEQQLVIQAYNDSAGTSLKTAEEMKRLLGAGDLREDISKIMAV